MAGWRRIEDQWWAGIAAHLPRPWPREAACQDLRWWSAPDRGLPGRRELADRWGWTERTARTLIADRATWADPLDLPVASVPAASQQRPSSVPAASQPAEVTTGNHYIERPSSVPAASQQRPSSVPRARSTLDPRPETLDPSPPISPPSPGAGPSAPASEPPQAPLRESPPDPTPETPSRPRQAPYAAGAPELALYAAWRGHHPRAGETPTREQIRSLGALLREAGSPEGALLLLEWAHTSEDQWARRLRGIEPWPDGSMVARLDLASLSRSVEGRLSQARAWAERGRTAAPTLRPRTNSAPPGRGARAAAALQEYLDPPTILDVEVSCRQSQKLLLS